MEALGAGDVLLVLAIGLVVGYPAVIYALAYGVLLGGLGAVVALIAGRAGPRGTLAYGPFLVLGALYALAGGR